MAYGFADIEAALARLFFIDPGSRSAFANRLKHLQRKGFPPGVNTGRGRAADYGHEHLVQLALALELISFGYTPEKAVAALEASQRPVAEGILRATDFEETVLCSFQPNGLSDLQKRVRFEPEDAPLRSITAAKAVEGIEALLQMQSAGHRIALFSLSGLISLCASLIGWDDDLDKRAEFFDALNRWAWAIIDGNP